MVREPNHKEKSDNNPGPLGDINCCFRNEQLFSILSEIYVFEDSEAVIKQINTGRSPTMRHVSRTHTVDLDW